jgi:hypothetical protein
MKRGYNELWKGTGALADFEHQVYTFPDVTNYYGVPTRLLSYVHKPTGMFLHEAPSTQERGAAPRYIFNSGDRAWRVFFPVNREDGNWRAKQLGEKIAPDDFRKPDGNIDYDARDQAGFAFRMRYGSVFYINSVIDLGPVPTPWSAEIVDILIKAVIIASSGVLFGPRAGEKAIFPDELQFRPAIGGNWSETWKAPTVAVPPEFHRTYKHIVSED